MNAQTLNEIVDNIATAPGDLPLDQVIKRMSLRSRQFRHDNTVTPLAPKAGDPVEIWATRGREVPVKRAAVWYTTDGSLPNDQSHAVPMEIVQVDWEPLVRYLNRWRAVIPARRIPISALAGAAWCAAKTTCLGCGPQCAPRQTA